MKKALTITKDNKMIEAGYRLTLSEQRLILACIGQVDSRHPHITVANNTAIPAHA